MCFKTYNNNIVLAFATVWRLTSSSMFRNAASSSFCLFEITSSIALSEASINLCGIPPSHTRTDTPNERADARKEYGTGKRQRGYNWGTWAKHIVHVVMVQVAGECSMFSWMIHSGQMYMWVCVTWARIYYLVRSGT